MCLLCGYSSRQGCDVIINAIGLALNIVFILIEVATPSYRSPAHEVLLVAHGAWAVSAALLITASCTQRQFLVYFGIFVQLIALVAFTYFVVLVPHIYLIVILVVLIVWWMFTVSSFAVGKLVREELRV